MKKCKVLVVAVLVFMLSAQTVLGAGLSSKRTATEGECENTTDAGQLSENSAGTVELQTEGEFYYRGETSLNNLWDEMLTDIYGSPVSLQGEERKAKIIIGGMMTRDPYTISSIRYLEEQFAHNPRVSLVAVDVDGSGLDAIRSAVGGAGFSKTVFTSTNDNDSDNLFWTWETIILNALGSREGDTVYMPAIYVVDSNDVVRYVSAGYHNGELAPLVNYVKGMDEVTGINEIRAFVTRLYAYALGRQPDANGLNDWVTKLMNKQITGTTAAIGFFDSDELKNRNLSNEEYVELLYKVMMNRSSDAGGKSYWVNLLDSGVSRMGVFNGFAGSTEFDTICRDYGIDRGTASAAEGRDKNYGVTQFVARLYTQALGRGYDIDGLNDWCNRIVSGAWSVTDVSTTGFFNSREFLNKNLNNQEYVKVLYRTFLGREYDAAGLKDWVGKLNSGAMSRDQVLKGFSYSTEFANIMKQYGL